MTDNKIISQEYRIAVTETLAILNNFSEETLNKIPKKLIEFFKEVSIKEYTFVDDKKEQQITNKTKDLLAMIYRNYLCTESEKVEFDKKLLQNEEEYQNKLKEKYNPDIFENRKEENSKMISLVEYKEESWYKKILKNILHFFRR